jgi:2,3-dimethylmalate lyase
MAAFHGWFKQRVSSQRPLLTLVGAVDPLSAKLIQQAGAEAVYAGGFATTASQFGLPDLGLLGLSEMADIYRRICIATPALPLVADADTGHGGLLNVERTIHTFAAAGVAACHIEDQTSPKRCGHLAGKDVVDRELSVARVATAVAAARASGMGIIARTDAIAVHGFEEAITRGRAFLAAGADAVFIDAPVLVDQIKAIPKLLGGPALFNSVPSGKSPAVSSEEIAAFGYAVQIHPVDVLLTVATAARSTISEILGLATPEPVSFPDIQHILGAPQHIQREQALAELGEV